MVITQEWLASIQDDQGLTPGQAKLLKTWEARGHFVGYGILSDQVAHVIETCKGYRGMPQHLRDLLKGAT